MDRVPNHSSVPNAVAASQVSAPAVALTGAMAKSVIVVEDDSGLREQLVKILNSAPGIRCVGACPSAEEALRLIPARKPDVVLMDIRLPAMSGIDCVAALKQIVPGLQIIVQAGLLQPEQREPGQGRAGREASY